MRSSSDILETASYWGHCVVQAVGRFLLAAAAAVFSVGHIVWRPVTVLGTLSLIFCFFPAWRVVVDFEHVRPPDVMPLIAVRAQWFREEALMWVLGCAGAWSLLRMVSISIVWVEERIENP